MADKKGLIHLYHGNGKGKTTCAVGLLVRALGSGKKALFIQFMKTGKSSEIAALEKLDGIKIIEAPRMKRFSFDMTEDEKKEMKELYDEELDVIREEIEDDGYDMLVMDEFVGAVQKGLLDEDKAMSLIKEKPERLEVIVTGRHPSDRLIELADYVTEMEKEKHPYDEGIKARKGIEF